MNPREPQELRVSVVQDGARLHYAVPLALHQAGVLGRMFTEWFLVRGSLSNRAAPVLRQFSPNQLKSMFERRCDQIPANLVRTNPGLVLRYRLEERHFASNGAAYRWYSAVVGRWIRREGLGDCNVLHGFIRNIDPKLLKWARQQGVATIADQMIAPSSVEGEEARRQWERFADWEQAPRGQDYELVSEVERATWKELDSLTCASEYVRQGLLGEGVAGERIRVIPYPIDAGHYVVPQRSGRTGPITVGFVGAVNLRKGAPYFFQVAKKLASANLKFVMVGEMHLNQSVAASHGDCVQWVGRVPRSQVSQWLEKFDMVLFPSTCEGSAGSAMEAMACGLPLVTSPNSGSVVRDGVDGFVRPYDDIDGLCQCVERLAIDPSLRLQMGAEARRHVETMDLAHYGSELIQWMSQSLSVRSPAGTSRRGGEG